MDMNKTVVVTPNVGGDELTARLTHDGQQVGKLLRGKRYQAVEEYKGMLRILDKREYAACDYFPSLTWPQTGVWADARFLPEYVPAPDPEPEPEPEPQPTGDIWRTLVLEIGRTIVRVMEG